jgi:hypothetical protein
MGHDRVPCHTTIRPIPGMHGTHVACHGWSCRRLTLRLRRRNDTPWFACRAGMYAHTDRSTHFAPNLQ